MRRVGAYAKLLANYASDDAIIAAGEAAELLFVRGLAFCATSDSDGYITEGQLSRVVGAGMKDAPKRAKRLVAEGLWESTEDGYVVRSWLKIHEAAEEKGRKRSTDRERKRSERGSDSEPCPSGQDAMSERNPEGVTTDSLLCSYVSSSSGTEQSTTEQSSALISAKSAQKRGTRIPADWTPDEATRTWTLDRIPERVAAVELEKFRNYWSAKTGRDATKLDWPATWRNWVLNTNTRGGRASPASDGLEDTLQRMETMR